MAQEVKRDETISIVYFCIRSRSRVRDFSRQRIRIERPPRNLMTRRRGVIITDQRFTTLRTLATSLINNATN